MREGWSSALPWSTSSSRDFNPEMHVHIHAALGREGVRARSAGHCFPQMIAGCDDGFLPAASQEAQNRFDLGTHIPGRKMSHRQIPLQLVRTNLPKGPLRRLLEIYIDEISIGGNNEQLDAELGR